MSGISFSDNFNDALKNASKNLLSSMEQATAKNAYLLQANITKGIRDQKYSWDPLKDETVRRKAKKGLDKRILMEGDSSRSEDLWKSFEVLGVGSNYHVGSNAEYARAQEFGYEASGIPARPYFQPAMEDSFEEMKVNWKNAVKGSFKL